MPAAMRRIARLLALAGASIPACWTVSIVNGAVLPMQAAFAVGAALMVPGIAVPSQQRGH